MLCHACKTRNNKQLKHFRVFGHFCTHHGNDGIWRNIVFQSTSAFSDNIMDWNDVWKINETLLYKGIIDFSRFTAHHENDEISRSIVFQSTSAFSNNIMDWNEVWKINETLLYKGIIHLSRSTANHENDQNQRKALVVCCSVFQRTDLWKSRKRE